MLNFKRVTDSGGESWGTPSNAYCDSNGLRIAELGVTQQDIERLPDPKVKPKVKSTYTKHSTTRGVGSAIAQLLYGDESFADQLRTYNARTSDFDTLARNQTLRLPQLLPIHNNDRMNNAYARFMSTLYEHLSPFTPMPKPKHLRGMDFDQPVEILRLPKGAELVQYSFRCQ